MAEIDMERVSVAEKTAVITILLTGVLVRLPGLGESLWFDEIYYTMSTFKQPGMFSFLLFGDVHPPLYAVLLLGWTVLFGDTEVSVRLPSFLSGTMSLVLVWMMARRWLGTRPAILALVFLALSPPHIWYSHENKNNMFLFLSCTAAVWFYWRAAEDNTKRDWASATVCLILSLWTHAFALSVASAVALWIAWQAWTEKTWLRRHALFSALAVGLAWGPLALFKLSQGARLARGYLRPFTPEELYKFLLVWLAHGNTIRTVNPYSSFTKLLDQSWLYFLVDGFFALVLVWGLVRVCGAARGENGAGETPVGQTSSRAWSARLLLLWFVLPLLLTLAGSLVMRHFYIERNLLILLSPFTLIMALGAHGQTHRVVRSLVIGLFLAFSVLGTWNLLVAKTDLWTVYKLKPDWRSAADYFHGEKERQNGAVLITTCPTNELSYYDQQKSLTGKPTGVARPKITVVDFCSNGPQKALEATREKGLKSFFLVYNTTWRGCFNDARAAFSNDPRFRPSETREFKGLRIYKYEVVGPDSRPVQK